MVVQWSAARATKCKSGSNRMRVLIGTTTCLLLGLTLASSRQAQAQDLLRRQAQQPATAAGASSNDHLLASIQLPPQLASLTPQQLHQLAQLREMQIQQQEAAARGQAAQEQAPVAPPALLGLEAAVVSAAPTAQPAAAPSSGQIPQPTPASADSNERHEEGAYAESGTELEGMSSGPSNGAAEQAGGGQPSFEVNWNKCPQLEPSEAEKGKKTQVITKCLQSAPIPQNLTRESVEAHREQIATCALKVEGWFDELGSYRYEKAEAEIRAKRLEPAIELQVLKFHVACKEEASKKFPREQNKLIDQVQFYQACMDYYISIVCEIEVSVDQ